VIDPHPSHRAPSIDINGIPFLGIGDMNENGKIINENSRKVSPFVYEEHAKRYNLNDKLIGLGRVASIGKVLDLKIISEKFTISPTLGLIKSRDIDRDFLIQILNFRSTKEQFRRIMSGSTRSSVGMIVLRKLLIPYPKLPEQTAIATALSDMDALIAQTEKLIEKKKAIKQGVMQELLRPKEGWVTKKLGEVCEIIMGQSPLSEYYNFAGIGLPLIQGNADIKNRKTIIRTYSSNITKKGKPGDIIMTVRAPVGEIAISTFECCLGRGVCALRYDNDFMYHYLISMENYWSRLSSGSTFDSVNSNQIKELSVTLPQNKNEQLEIATILTELDENIELTETKLKKLKHQKQGMMQTLLTGKIRLV
jgi:type I restriction enzyme S subunit